MKKTILITGSTDGIGLETARMLVLQGHHVLLHGRSQTKLERVAGTLATLPGHGCVESYLADLSRIPDADSLARSVIANHSQLDVLINNAGVYNTPEPVTENGLDVRFVVNTLAPYLMTHRLLPLLGTSGRVINLSSAAQAPVDLKALAGDVSLSADSAYAQSKLALTMWSRSLALSLKGRGPAIIAINPGSLLGTKMVKEAFGVAGADIRQGAEILCRAALGDDFEDSSGQYFDGDSGRFTPPHPDALDPGKTRIVIDKIETLLTQLS